MSGNPSTKDTTVLCVLTGASRGFGRSLAVALSQTFKSDSVFILLARSMNDLEAAKEEMLQMSNLSPDHILPFYLDQGQFSADIATKLFQDIRAQLSKLRQQFHKYLLIHNSGTLGDITKKSSQFGDFDEISAHFNVNVSGMIALNTKCLELFDDNSKCIIVNISSLAAIQPVNSFSLYCANKAARNMYFKVLAGEEKDLRILNYAPGPLDTDMQKNVRENAVDDTIRQQFTEMFNSSKLVSCEDSAEKLIDLLEKDTYTNGDHIDYYDD
ncbi:sepiapterin reductase [Octopus bimaculoides]|uniref:Sepiapterin reductase n=1 Tax=Octopus bimaculoides TaxID=37653 RepID=A0A0L8GGL2_OCTBM|nr:sepiapterin reductase [Octopus bimaculoides]|eukprot:XP_014781561.1 PREDICTED: sepiapterin reductase-like [Octopus bimaculoides]